MNVVTLYKTQHGTLHDAYVSHQHMERFLALVQREDASIILYILTAATACGPRIRRSRAAANRKQRYEGSFVV
jgi:hypothetical protein